MEQTPDRDVESHLRHGAGREWLEEAAEDEQLTELLRMRRLDLSGTSPPVGSPWSVCGPRREPIPSPAGSCTPAGTSPASIGATTGVDRVLDSAIWTRNEASWVATSRAATNSPSAPPGSPKSRLQWRWCARSLSMGGPSSGRSMLRSPATDHAESTQDGNTIVVPIRQIAAGAYPLYISLLTLSVSAVTGWARTNSYISSRKNLNVRPPGSL